MQEYFSYHCESVGPCRYLDENILLEIHLFKGSQVQNSCESISGSFI